MLIKMHILQKKRKTSTKTKLMFMT